MDGEEAAAARSPFARLGARTSPAPAPTPRRWPITDPHTCTPLHRELGSESNISPFLDVRPRSADTAPGPSTGQKKRILGREGTRSLSSGWTLDQHDLSLPRFSDRQYLVLASSVSSEGQRPTQAPWAACILESGMRCGTIARVLSGVDHRSSCRSRPTSNG